LNLNNKELPHVGCIVLWVYAPESLDVG
jgi:hypothetical protein